MAMQPARTGRMQLRAPGDLWGDVRTPLGLLVLAILASGCLTLRTYSGPPRAESRVAVLKPVPMHASRVILESVDGRPCHVLHDRVEVLPGRHRLVASVVLEHAHRFAIRRHALWVEVEAGRSYEIRGDWYLYGPRLLVEDEGSGELVATAVIEPRRRLPPVGSAPPGNAADGD